MAQLTQQSLPAFVVVGMVAVFGAAARVPIAALLMVTEMTGGYHMLVPAALAVTLAHITQVSVSSWLPYRSLYEAQVPRRRDSPAHYEEHLRTAFRLLGRQQLALPPNIGRIDLLRLLASGVPVDLPDGKQLRLAALRPESTCVGQTIESGCLTTANTTFEVVGVTRDEDFLLAEPGLRLEANDRLLVICSRSSWDVLAQHVEPIARQRDGRKRE